MIARHGARDPRGRVPRRPRAGARRRLRDADTRRARPAARRRCASNAPRREPVLPAHPAARAEPAPRAGPVRGARLRAPARAGGGRALRRHRSRRVDRALAPAPWPHRISRAGDARAGRGPRRSRLRHLRTRLLLRVPAPRRTCVRPRRCGSLSREREAVAAFHARRAVGGDHAHPLALPPGLGVRRPRPRIVVAWTAGGAAGPDPAARRAGDACAPRPLSIWPLKNWVVFGRPFYRSTTAYNLPGTFPSARNGSRRRSCSDRRSRPTWRRSSRALRACAGRRARSS